MPKDQAPQWKGYENLHGSLGLRPRGGVPKEEPTGEAPEEIVNRSHAPRQDHGAHVVEDLQSASDLVAARSVDDADSSEMFPQVPQLLAVAPLALLLQPIDDSVVQAHEEAEVQVLASLEEGTQGNGQIRDRRVQCP